MFHPEQDQDVPFWSCLQAVSKPVWHIPLLCVQWKTPDDGQRNCPKHVEFYSKNKLEKLVHLVGFIIRNLSRCTVTWTSNSCFYSCRHPPPIYVSALGSSSCNKAIPVQAWAGPESSRSLRLPEFLDIRYMQVARLSAQHIGHVCPPNEIFLVLIFDRGWVEVSETSQWPHRESNPPHSGL